MKQKLGKDEHIDSCTRNKRNGIACLKAGIWKMGGIRRAFEKGRDQESFRERKGSGEHSRKEDVPYTYTENEDVVGYI
jgi:hypothetical protein